MSAEASARACLAHAARRTFTLPHGIELAALEWGEPTAPIVLLHHANGFCKGIWAVIADALRARSRVVAIDARGHGDSAQPEGPHAYAWSRFADDLLAVATQLRALSGHPIALGVGHSFGGTAMIGAAARQDDLFARLVLIDPVIPPPPGTAGGRQPHIDHLVGRARRRRAEWPSRQAARAWCASRPLFRAWQPEAIELYLLDGLRERADGSLALKCPPAVEAAVFAGSAGTDVFDLARRVHTPMELLWAARGDFPRPLYEALAAVAPQARVETVDAGHLVPMEQPDTVAAALRRFLLLSR